MSKRKSEDVPEVTAEVVEPSTEIVPVEEPVFQPMAAGFQQLAVGSEEPDPLAPLRQRAVKLYDRFHQELQGLPHPEFPKLSPKEQSAWMGVAAFSFDLNAREEV